MLACIFPKDRIPIFHKQIYSSNNCFQVYSIYRTIYSFCANNMELSHSFLHRSTCLTLECREIVGIQRVQRDCWNTKLNKVKIVGTSIYGSSIYANGARLLSTKPPYSVLNIEYWSVKLYTKYRISDDIII